MRNSELVFPIRHWNLVPWGSEDMQQGSSRLAQTLRILIDEIAAWNPEDSGLVTAFVEVVQEALQQAPEAMPEIRALLHLALEGLQALPQLEVDRRRDLATAITAAMAVCEKCVRTENDPDRFTHVDDAARELLRILGRNPEVWAEATKGQGGWPVSGTELTLDDVAALLMQLEVSDTGELVQVRDALNRVANAQGEGVSSSALARTRAAEAAQCIDRIIQGTASDPQRALIEAGQLIATAAEALEEAEEAASRVPESPAMPASDGGSPQTSELLPEDVDSELLSDFITECREYINGAEAALLDLETNPEDMEAVNTVFRAFHTIKGTAAFLGLTLVSELAHRAESLLSRMRDQDIRCVGGYADLALRSVDMLKALMQALQDAMNGAPAGPPVGLQDLLDVLSDPEAAGVSEEEASPSPPRLGDILVAEGKATREVVETTAAVQGQEPLGLTLTRSEGASLHDVARALRTQRRLGSKERAVESSVRVRTDRLDRLIDMVGELVIAHSMVAQDEIVLHGGHHSLLKKITHVGKIVRELQDLSMSMRMVPFRTTFQKMARVVRDVAQKNGKAVNFVTDGEDTEIDRNMVDIISDPLVHMVRNAVDHGIEPPEVREQQGKPRVGVVRLSAYHAGGSVVVELQDDGRGLDRNKLVAKAIAKGLIESDKGMSDSDVFNLIFEPGFSTAEQVTDVSGRGVGMDVVRRGVDALKGHIDISSEKGKGTTFSVRLPLTLAITDGMLVRVGSERYIIPTINIYVSFRPEAAALSTVVGRGELVVLRDELIPLFRLHRLFNVAGAVENPTQGLLVVVNDGERHCALLVDELLGQQQVVAKPLGVGLGDVPGISGAAILGDGRVGLILDPPGIVALARQTPFPSSKDGRAPSAA
jgi:two-component system chemotaxis sensor kinase CheA